MDESKKTTDVPGYRSRAGMEVSKGGARGNGRVGKYQQDVSPSRPPTRAEVEARLKATSESISTRLESLQSELGFDGDNLASWASKPLVSVALAAGAGLLIGRMIGSVRGRGSSRDALVDLLVDAVESARSEGEPMDEAIDRVLEATRLRVGDHGESGGMFKLLGLITLRSIVRQIVSQAADRFTGGEAENPTEEEPEM